MRFSILGLASLAAIAHAANDLSQCGDGPFANAQHAGPDFPGDDDPETQCDSKWQNGETIVGIEAWSAKFQVKAVRFKFSQSGWGPVRGSVPTDNVQAHELKEWNAGDEVGIRLWNNKPDDGDPMDAVGRIIITQGGNNIFEVGGNAKKVDKSEITVDNAGGLILGAKTRSGAWLSSIEFKMLKSKVMSTELVELNVAEDLTKWNEEQRGIDQVSLGDAYFKNTNALGGANQTFLFTNTASRETSKTITSQKTNQWTTGIQLMVGGEIGIPFVSKGKAELTTKFEYQRQNMDSTATTESQRKDLSLAQGSGAVANMIPPQRAIHCESWAVTGRFDGDYTGKIEATLADGSKYLYNDAGSVNSVGWEKASSECKEIALTEVPSGLGLDGRDVMPKTKKVRGMGWFRF